MNGRRTQCVREVVIEQIGPRRSLQILLDVGL
jgi:hypothetical protein